MSINFYFIFRMIRDDIFSSNSNGNIFEQEIDRKNDSTIRRKTKVIWRNVIIMSYINLAAVYGLYIAYTNTKLQTVIFCK